MKRLRQIRDQLGRTFAITGAAFSVAVLVLGYSGSAVFAATAGQNTRMQLFNTAAQEFGVPAQVLVALSYNESRWQAPEDSSVDGGFGLMNLRTKVPNTVSGRDGSPIPASVQAKQTGNYTLDQAASLLHVPADNLKTNDLQNVRGAAAVLAQSAKQLNGGHLPTSPGDWYGAVAQFSGSGDATVASTFADDVFATIQKGASLKTMDGQAMNVPTTPNIQPNKQTMSALNLHSDTSRMQTQTLPGQNPECPSTLNCRFVPAAYAQNSADPADYGNYDPAHRPTDMQIKYIYIHDTEGSYDSAISHFQDPTSYVSANYVVRSSDGAVTQMVPNSGVSWGIGDWYGNMHGINIENEGVAAQGANWYTPAMYKTNAELVRYLAAKYHIPLDRQHILGHDNVMTTSSSRLAGQHWDPGPYWDWDYFMSLVRGDTSAAQDANFWNRQLKKGDTVTIAPTFATNQPPVTDCQTGTCTNLPAQGASFVYLRTQPNASAPLISDTYTNGSNPAGTTRDNDWGDKAPSGFKYVVADVQGDWTAIWFGGKQGWFYNPQGQNQTAHRSWSATITPKPGMNSVAVYGVAYPEASAYPTTIPVQNFDALYTLPAGQSYTTTGENLPTDYFYDATINYSLPDDHMVVRGNQKYYQISLNHRIGYVKASDVTLNW
ncbi:MAG TPA: peptidoglycan recognition family protein [Candidatus Saccharimonadales bacterium]|nr:peptidoglycan recognition family protein [Candidatus Saccharimonadales bacterium]